MKLRKKIYSLPTLESLTKDIKGQGLTIGLTHGAFDLFHLGHMELLKTSAEVCDFLIVAVENDKNLREYKGENRPIIPEQQRLGLLSQLEVVDAAMIYNGQLKPSGYSELYKSLNVDYVTIGSEFTFDEIMDQQVKDGNAKLIRINTQRIQQTGRIIEDILKRYNKKPEVIGKE